MLILILATPKSSEFLPKSSAYGSEGELFRRVQPFEDIYNVRIVNIVCLRYYFSMEVF